MDFADPTCADFFSKYSAIVDSDPRDYNSYQFSRLVKIIFAHVNYAPGSPPLTYTSIALPSNLNAYKWLLQNTPMPPPSQTRSDNAPNPFNDGAPLIVPDIPIPDTQNTTHVTNYAHAMRTHAQSPPQFENRALNFEVTNRNLPPAVMPSPLGHNNHSLVLPPILGSFPMSDAGPTPRVPLVQSLVASRPPEMLPPLAGLSIPRDLSNPSRQITSHIRTGAGSAASGYSSPKFTGGSAPDSLNATSLHTPDNSGYRVDFPLPSLYVCGRQSSVGSAPDPHTLQLSSRHALDFPPLPASSVAKSQSGSVGATKANTNHKGCSKGRRPGGPAHVSEQEARCVRGTTVKLFEEGKSVETLFGLKSNPAWATEIERPGQSKNNPAPIFAQVDD
ncbi:hypothetical protein FRC09_018057 [Ceratobasidium sp. 395]|nr:hypothetical protein FRC09_018057 [Ceratobasidium sp. 395]